MSSVQDLKGALERMADALENRLGVTSYSISDASVRRLVTEARELLIADAVSASEVGIAAIGVDSSGEMELELTIDSNKARAFISKEFWNAVGERWVSEKSEQSCLLNGEPCPKHSDVVHGAEAEELRSGIQTLINRKHYAVSHLEDAPADLLDRIDARDSLAFLEASKKKQTQEKQIAEQPKKSCYNCKHSGSEPDCDMYCGHPDTGFWGVTLRTEPAAHCPNYSKFEQHPLRLPKKV